MAEELYREKALPSPAHQESTLETLAKALIAANKLLQEKDQKLLEKENEILKMQEYGKMAQLGSDAERYRMLIKDYTEKMKEPKRLRTIYTIVKNCYEYEAGIKKPADK